LHSVYSNIHSSRHSPVRLLRRQDAARYLSVSPGTFDKLVREHQIPQPKVVGEHIRAWDVLDLDSYVDDLPHRNGEDTVDTSWDDFDAT
jgi:excisionase family DNA binding protein